MAAAQRPGGQQAKICQFKLVLLGKSLFPHFPRNSELQFLPAKTNHISLLEPVSSTSFTSGESAVGKSSLVLRFVKGQFHEFQEVSRQR